jgi:hypothetical protein
MAVTQSERQLIRADTIKNRFNHHPGTFGTIDYPSCLSDDKPKPSAFIGVRLPDCPALALEQLTLLQRISAVDELINLFSLSFQ